jgi:Tol biopolymer transport system component
MVMTRIVAGRSLGIVAIALALSSPMGAQSGHELFQQALSKERAEGKLQEAIALYQRVVDVAATDHALAAKALLQLGRCYETLGSTEARTAYERLIARYPDQGESVALARTRLTALARNSPTATPAAMTVVALPDVSKDGELVTVAPDGTKAIVMEYSKGQVNLAVYDFSTKQKRQLTEFWYTFFAVWSPDARRVAYHMSTFDASELRVATLDGRSSAVYRNDGSQSVQPVGWTPDGATLIVVVRRPDKTWVVGTLPATGGSFTPLRSLGWSYDWRDGSPRLSPDGRFVAYLEGEKGLRDVHVVSLDGRDASRITDDPADDMAPLWSPDGRHLAFSSTRLGSVALWKVEVRDGKPVGQAAKLKEGMQSARLLDWTQRGIFYDQQTRTWDLYTAPMDSVEGRSTASPRLVPYSRTGRNLGPVWSPDGGRLAFISSAAAEPNRRYVVVTSPDDEQPREFLIPTTAFQYPQSPTDLRWFGDGRGLGFSGTDSRGAPAVFRLRLDTGEWHTIPLNGDEGIQASIEWNRDGSAFYFKRRGFENAGIFERTVDGDKERPVYRSAMPVLNIRSLEFSPDRKLLAFQQWTTEADAKTITKRILAVDVATGETRTLFEVAGNATESPDSAVPNLVGWSPANELLIERRGTAKTPAETLLVPINGGAPRSIAIPKFGTGRRDETSPDLSAKLSPDGKSIVLVRVSRGWETYVIENPLAGVRATTASR